mgnify:FL=1
MIIYLIAGVMVIFILTLAATLGYIQKFKTDDLYIFTKVLFGNFILWSLVIGVAALCKYIELFT